MAAGQCFNCTRTDEAHSDISLEGASHSNSDSDCKRQPKYKRSLSSAVGRRVHDNLHMQCVGFVCLLLQWLACFAVCSVALKVQACMGVP